MVLHLMLVALVGVQKLAAANSNTATRHIQDGMLAITQYMADCLTLRISDVLEYHPDERRMDTKYRCTRCFNLR